MYGCGGFLITSPNYPDNYPNDQNNVTEMSVVDVDGGDLIEITFTDFSLEDSRGCVYDYVRIVDGNGEELLPRTCGDHKDLSEPILSKTKTAFLTFVSDHSEVRSGFRAEWRAVEVADPVDGSWSEWGAWSQCSNKRSVCLDRLLHIVMFVTRDGKSECVKHRFRYCSNPPASNGGNDCEGDDWEESKCTDTGE